MWNVYTNNITVDHTLIKSNIVVGSVAINGLAPGTSADAVMTDDRNYVPYMYSCDRYLWPLILTWINFNPSMDK